MATFQSIQSATGTTSVVITKPIGLAVGDVMLAAIWVDNDGASTVFADTPSGWTLVQSEITPTNVSELALFRKTADSSDVAASNFTFASSGGQPSRHMIGHIVRLTNVGSVAGLVGARAVVSGTTLTFNGFTPTKANSLFLVFSGQSSSTSQYNTTSVSLATDNPSWTEQADSTYNDTTRDSSLAVYTATRSQITATGDVVVTYSNASAGRQTAIVYALAPQVNGSFSAPDTKVNAYAFTPIQTVVVDAIVDAPTTNARNVTRWTNDTKPSTTWTNDTL
jgi:hypothetical protein